MLGTAGCPSSLKSGHQSFADAHALELSMRFQARDTPGSNLVPPCDDRGRTTSVAPSPRGAITFGPGSPAVRLSRDTDWSTPAHRSRRLRVRSPDRCSGGGGARVPVIARPADRTPVPAPP